MRACMRAGRNNLPTTPLPARPCCVIQQVGTGGQYHTSSHLFLLLLLLLLLCVKRLWNKQPSESEGRYMLKRQTGEKG
jgi:hypothetical protein